MEDVLKANGIELSNEKVFVAAEEIVNKAGVVAENSSKQRRNLDEQDDLLTPIKENLPKTLIRSVSPEGMEAANILINNLSQSQQKKLLKSLLKISLLPHVQLSLLGKLKMENQS